MEEQLKENTIEVTTTYEVDDSNLKEIRTPLKIIPEITTYNIDEIQKEIDKINAAITQWENKRAPLQAIIDKYNEINNK